MTITPDCPRPPSPPSSSWVAPAALTLAAMLCLINDLGAMAAILFAGACWVTIMGER